jgi:Skp family chaperone for outer membrane proteins
MIHPRSPLVFTAATLIVAVAASAELNPCLAKDGDKPKQARGTVAVLDLNRIFKESKRFKAAMEKMKSDVDKAEKKVKDQRDKIKAQRDELEKLPADSDDRMKKEEDQSRLEAALAASLSLQKKTFLMREARLYLDLYQIIESEVAAYAKEHGVDVVLRINSEPADANKPDSVLQQINRPTVWYSPDADITAIISERVEKHQEGPAEKGK